MRGYLKNKLLCCNNKLVNLVDGLSRSGCPNRKVNRPGQSLLLLNKMHKSDKKRMHHDFFLLLCCQCRLLLFILIGRLLCRLLLLDCLLVFVIATIGEDVLSRLSFSSPFLGFRRLCTQVIQKFFACFSSFLFNKLKVVLLCVRSYLSTISGANVFFYPCPVLAVLFDS